MTSPSNNIASEAGAAITLQIRQAQRVDIEQLDQLFQHLDVLHARLQPCFFQASVGRVRRRTELDEYLGQAHATLLVAKRGAVIIGLISVRLYDTPSHPQMVKQRRAYINDLVVREEDRRQGVGRALVAEATRWAESRGAEQIVLTLWTGNQSAELFYKQLGFRSTCQVLCREIR